MDKDLSSTINRQAHAIAHSAQLQLKADLHALALDMLDQGQSPAQVIESIRLEGSLASQYTLYRRELVG